MYCLDLDNNNIIKSTTLRTTQLPKYYVRPRY